MFALNDYPRSKQRRFLRIIGCSQTFKRVQLGVEKAGAQINRSIENSAQLSLPSGFCFQPSANPEAACPWEHMASTPCAAWLWFCLQVFHGADSDIEWLQKDFGLYVVNMFDTHQAARLLNLGRHSLDHLLKHYCNVESNKQYQLADWRIRSVCS